LSRAFPIRRGPGYTALHAPSPNTPTLLVDHDPVRFRKRCECARAPFARCLAERRAVEPWVQR